MVLALPLTCSRRVPSDGTYGGGVEPSPAGRVNPFEGRIPNSGTDR